MKLTPLEQAQIAYQRYRDERARYEHEFTQKQKEYQAEVDRQRQVMQRQYALLAAAQRRERT